MISIFGRKRDSKEEPTGARLLDLRQPKPLARDGLDQTAPTANDQDSTLNLQSSFGNAAVARTMIQRKAEADEISGVASATSETATSPSEAPAGAAQAGVAAAATATQALIVADNAETLAPGQMKKSEFLAQLRSAVSSAAGDALAGSPLAVVATPYIDNVFAQYAAQSSTQLEGSLRRYAPEAAAVTNAGSYIPIVTGRVRRSLTTFVTTGELPQGLPMGLPPTGTLGAVGGAVSSVASGVADVASSVASGIGSAVSAVSSLLFKEHDGGARTESDPEAIQSQLGGGQSLDAGVRTRMESAFGEGFGGVQIHADTKGAGLSEGLNARAFTVGQHIAFGTGEYQPGTLIGDALIAHELAHVMQQRGGATTTGPAQKGTSDYGGLEDDADRAAVGAVVSSWTGANKGLAKIARNALPGLKSGLRLQRCGGGSKKAVTPKEPTVLTDFAGKFADAAEMIRKSESAMKLVTEAEVAAVKFGGYSEEGPVKNAWPYTLGVTVYVPKAQTDKVVAMSDFLFELNNAVRSPKFREIEKDAAGGSITAKAYAYKNVEQEVEGMLRMGEVWFETKKALASGTDWNKYDGDFYLAEYQSFKDGKKTKDDIVKDVLKRVYPSGKDAGKTTEQFYIDQYNDIRSAK